jgi:hypothetical protein
MRKWRKSDIGKRIVCRVKSDLGNKLEDKKVIIYDVNSKVPDTVRFAESPLIYHERMGDIQAPIELKSKIGLVYVVKKQEKEGKEYMKDLGDWYFVDKVSNDQKRILKIIADSPKRLSD